MKSLKLIVINALTLLIGLGLLTGSLSQRNANAARFEVIPALQIAKLGNYRGQYLTILYAVGSRPFISTDSSQINISQVKESRTIYITDDAMTTPIVQVEKEGFRPSYNIVVFCSLTATQLQLGQRRRHHPARHNLNKQPPKRLGKHRQPYEHRYIHIIERRHGSANN
jgi:hypothetical protein